MHAKREPAKCPAAGVGDGGGNFHQSTLIPAISGDYCIWEEEARGAVLTPAESAAAAAGED
jgi:hypothetical protein